MGGAALGSVLYTFGGGNCPTCSGFGGNELTMSESFDASTGTWAIEGPLASGLFGLSAVGVSGKVYLVGGTSGTSSTPSESVVSYYPGNQYFNPETSMRTPRWKVATAAIDAKIFAIGGGATGSPTTPTSIVEEYDTATRLWTPRRSLSVSRYGAAADTLNGKVYVTGGRGVSGSALQSTEIYDALGDSWSQGPDMPIARWDHAMVFSGGKFYAIGGWNGSTTLSDVAELDPATNSWSIKAPMPTPRSGLSAAMIDGKIYAFGGATDTSAVSVLEVYDPVSNTWESDINRVPMIASVSPSSGTQGQVISSFAVTGKGFQAGAQLTITGTGVSTRISAVSLGQITAELTVSPTAPSGPRDVVVTNSNGMRAVLVGAFTVTQAPPAPLTVTLATDKQAYNRGQAAILMGLVATTTGTPMPSIPIVVEVSKTGLSRSFSTTTNTLGAYQVLFQPNATEAGTFTVRVTASSGSNSATTNGTLRVLGLHLSPASTSLEMAMGTTKTIILALQNLGDATLNSLNFSLTDGNPSDAVSAAWAPSPSGSSLSPGASLPFGIAVTAPAGTPPPSSVSFTVRSTATDGISGVQEEEVAVVTITLRPAISSPTLVPSVANVGVKQGDRVTQVMAVRNDGYIPIVNATVTIRDSANFNWVVLGNSSLGTLNPGDVKEFFVQASPIAAQATGAYSIVLDITGGSTPASGTVIVNVVSASAPPPGSATFIISNDAGLKVAGAQVTLTDNANPATTFSGVSDSSGVAVINGITPGNYSYAVAEKAHDPVDGSITITPGGNPTERVILTLNVVTLSFTINPTTITDQYNVTLTVTYTTDLQKPALRVLPQSITIASTTDDPPYQGVLSITNMHPTATVRNVSVVFPEVPGLQFTRETSEPLELKGKEWLTVPFLVRVTDANLATGDVGRIRVTGEYDYSLDGKAYIGLTKSEVPVTYVQPPELFTCPITFIYDETGAGLRFDGSSYLCSITANRLNRSFTFASPAEDPFRGRHLVAFTETEGGSSAADVVQKNKENSFWRTNLLNGKTILAAKGESATFDLAAIDEDSSRTLLQALQSELSSRWNRLLHNPNFMAFQGQWSDRAPDSYLIPISITTIRDNRVEVTSTIGNACTWCGGGTTPSPGASTAPKPLPQNTGTVQFLIDQTVKLERQAFNATLGIGVKSTLTGVQAQIQIRDTNGNNAAANFFLVVISDPAGATRGGTLASSSAVQWQLIPKADAGGNLASGRNYQVQATVNYSYNGVPLSATTQQLTITVLPSPKLSVIYSVPFVVMAGKDARLKVTVRNDGYGIAQNLRFDSAQPRIVSNPGNLPVAFTIAGSSNTETGTATPAVLQVNFGNVAPGATVSGYWVLRSSQHGYLVDMTSTFSQLDYAGIKLDPLVNPPTTQFRSALGGELKVNGALPTTDLQVQAARSGGDPRTTVASKSDGVFYFDELPSGQYGLNVFAGVDLLYRHPNPIAVLADQPTPLLKIGIGIPTLEPIQPQEVCKDSSTVLTLQGTGITGSVTATLNHSALSATVVVESTTSIKVTIETSAATPIGLYDLTLTFTKPDQTKAIVPLQNAIRVLEQGTPAPTVTKVWPEQGSQAVQGKYVLVKLTGSGFVSGTTLSFSPGLELANAKDNLTISPTTIEALLRVAPSAPPGQATISVTNPGCCQKQEFETFTVLQDTDQDGLADDWETAGFYKAKNRQGKEVQVELKDASPHRKDLFVFADWMPEQTHCWPGSRALCQWLMPDPTHRPAAIALAALQDAFKYTKVCGLDKPYSDCQEESRGINLHLEFNDNPVAHADMVGGYVNGNSGKVYCFSPETHPNCSAIKEPLLSSFKSTTFPSEYAPAYRYILFAHDIPHEGTNWTSVPLGVTSATWIFCAYGNCNTDGLKPREDITLVHPNDADILVSIPWRRRADASLFAGTIMHELGHSLGLAGDNHNPNYLSVMNYIYHNSGVTHVVNNVEKNVLEFSDLQLSTIDESALKETEGLRVATRLAGNPKGEITSETNSLQVADSAGFPAAPFKVSIGEETLNVDEISSDGRRWTVTRGTESTSPGSYRDGDVLTARSYTATLDGRLVKYYTGCGSNGRMTADLSESTLFEIDWNLRSGIQALPVGADVNRRECNATTTTNYKGVNDLNRLLFPQGAIGGLNIGTLASTTGGNAVGGAPAENRSIFLSHGKDAFGVSFGGSTWAAPGVSGTVRLQVHNFADYSRSIALVATTELGWIQTSGFPSSVTVGPDSTTNVDIPFTVPVGAAMDVRDRLTVRADAQGSMPTGGGDTTEVVASLSDLTLSSSVAAGTVPTGGQHTVNLKVKNEGPASVQHLRLLGRLDPGLRALSATIDGGLCSVVDAEVDCRSEGLAMGSELVAQVLLSPLQSGSFTVDFSVSGSSPDTVAGNNTLVYGLSTNTAPMLTVSPTITTSWGNSAPVTVSATDAEGHSLLFQLLEAPSGASIAPTTGAFSWIPTATQIGSLTFKVRVSDNGNPPLYSEKPVTVVVTKRPTLLTYSGATSGQYSDQFTVSASLTDAGGGTLQGSALPGRPIGFVLGSQSASGPTSTAGVAAAQVTISQPSGTPSLSATFIGDAYYLASNHSGVFTIQKEQATLEYTGDSLVTTSGAGKSAVVKFSAVVREDNDGIFGAKLTSTRVEFKVYKYTDTAMVAPVTSCSAPVSSTTAGSGTASCSVSLAADNYTVASTLAANDYYTSPVESQAVTVTDPGTGMTTGGGWLTEPTLLSRSNFGFTMKFQKNGQVQGKSLYIYRVKKDIGYGLREYNWIIKSNATGGLVLSCTNSTPKVCTSTFTGKSTITAVDRLTGTAYSQGGNFNYQVDLTDNGEPGASIPPDRYATRIWDSTGNYYVLGSYGPDNTGTTNTAQVPILGGNVQVKPDK
jgi:N-acetylneuraminic acid mutarotase